MEYLKEVFEEYASRSRSHFFGAIAISFLAFNWQPLYYVVYADVDIVDRFAYFDSSARLWHPIIVGTLLALATPIFTLAGSTWAQSFRTQMKKNQITAADEVQKHKDKLRQKRAAATVERGKKLDAELDKIEDDEVRDKVRESALTEDDNQHLDLTQKLKEMLSNLGNTEILILERLHASPEGDLSVNDLGQGDEVYIDGELMEFEYPMMGKRAISVLLDDVLIKYLMQSDISGSHYRLSTLGREMGQFLHDENDLGTV